MDVTIIGAGNMERGVGTRLVAGGHQVSVLGKEPLDAGDGRQRARGPARAGRSGEAIADDVVVLAVYYPDAKTAAEQHRGGLSGKVLIDITNPVNETMDGLVTPPNGSAAQELAASAPGARVGKAFNTTFAGTLIDGEVAGQPLDVLLAGDDEEAKVTVSKLVENGGLRRPAGARQAGRQGHPQGFGAWPRSAVPAIGLCRRRPRRGGA
jgi:predicted dinucleotide-binding enzyme